MTNSILIYTPLHQNEFFLKSSRIKIKQTKWHPKQEKQIIAPEKVPSGLLWNCLIVLSAFQQEAVVPKHCLQVSSFVGKVLK